MFRLPVQIKEQIEDYAHRIEEFKEGKISWARFSGIRVPWGNYSHRGWKVFMARVRIPAGILSPQQLQALAECSARFGNGVLHITTRQDIQIHQLKLEDIIKVHRYLKDYELSPRGGGGNTVRNITSCPLAGICPAEIFNVAEDAIALTEYLLSQDTSYTLPRKFKISFSGCGQDCIGAIANDLGLIAQRQNGTSGYQVLAGGGMGASSALGRVLEEFVPREEMLEVALAVKNLFYKYGDRRNKHHNRLRFLLEDIGFDKFVSYYREEREVLRKEGVPGLRKVEFSYPEEEGEIPEQEDEEFKKFLKYNCQPQKQKGLLLVKLRIPRGDLDSEKAIQLAELEKEFPSIQFRTSREQDLFVCNVKKKEILKFYNRLREILDEFLYPQTLLDVVACKGSLTCNLGLCNSPGLAEVLEKVLKQNFLSSPLLDKLNIKINGCPNACGQHPLGAIAFHGIVRRVSGRPVPFYKLLLGGRVGIKNSSLARDTGILIPAKNLPGFLKEFLSQLEKETRADIEVVQLIEQKGEEIANKLAEKYCSVPSYSENRDFYIDWGREEEFSLEGLGPGECGAGVMDMIEADLEEAKIALQQAEKQDYSSEEIKKVLFLASRALLVVRGIDPKSPQEAFAGFEEKFLKQEIASAEYSNLKEVYDFLSSQLSLEERKEKFSYARKFLEHIKQLYAQMDSSFNFPKQKKEEEKAKLLDLKGTPCPLNYVKAKLVLEGMEKGEILEVLLDEGEPIDNVPRSLENDGFQVLRIEKLNGFYKLVVKK